MYLDTSALVKLYVEEESGGELIRQGVEESEMIAVSTIAYAEARAGFARKQREGLFTTDELRGTGAELDHDWRTYARLDVSPPIAHQAGELAERHSLRGYDAVHLASAVRLSEKFDDLRFLAFDARLNGAAREAGLEVYGSGTSVGSDADV